MFVLINGSGDPKSGGASLSVTAGITASTTQAQGNGALTAGINEVSVVANASDTVTLPSTTAGRLIYVFNNGANTLQVFPASGDSIDGAAVDSAKTQATGANFLYVADGSTNWNRVNATL